MAADWLELDSPVEGIRFDSELVREIPHFLFELSHTSLFASRPCGKRLHLRPTFPSAPSSSRHLAKRTESTSPTTHERSTVLSPVAGTSTYLSHSQ